MSDGRLRLAPSMRRFNLVTCSDSAIEKAMQCLLDSPKLVKESGEWIYHAIAALGIERVLPAPRKLAPSHPHAATCLESLPLTEAQYASIPGSAPPPPALPVLAGKGPQYLSALQAHLAAGIDAAMIALSDQPTAKWREAPSIRTKRALARALLRNSELDQFDDRASTKTNKQA